MTCRSEHLYLKRYPINPKSKKLIVGTIHPADSKRFLIPFFYGNRNSLWTILRDAFPNEFLTSSPHPIELTEVLRFLNKTKISMSDTIVSCKRLSDSAQDRALSDLHLNTDLVEQILDSEIDQVFFTSGFGTNSAFRLFYQGILKKPLTSAMKSKREFIDQETFGRPVRYSILFSPSGSAMRSIARSQEYLKSSVMYAGRATPIKDFRTDQYRTAFSFINELQ